MGRRPRDSPHRTHPGIGWPRSAPARKAPGLVRESMRSAVYGSGGHGKVVADILTAASEHEVVAFLDDDLSKDGVMVGGLAVHAIRSNIREQAKQLKIGAIALWIGDNTARAVVLENLEDGVTAVGVPARRVKSTPPSGRG